MHGLKKKLLINYGLFIILTVFLAELVLLFSIKQYYYEQVSQTLLNRITVAAEFYNKFLPDYSLLDKADYIMEDVCQQQAFNVQVLDEQGYLIEDAEGFYYEDLIRAADVQKAIQGKEQVCTFTSDSGEKLMAISVPLSYAGQKVGYLRYICSTVRLNSEIKQISWLAVGAGLLVLVFSALFSLMLARRIIKPVEELTAAARQIATGDYSQRIVRQDNDEIGQLADTFNYMVGEIARTEEMKNDFISSISHELRTPLTSIKGWSETLVSGQLEDKEETLMGMNYIAEETDRLIDLVEDLLDFSKYQACGIILSLEIVNLNNLVQEVVQQFQPLAREKGVDLKLKMGNSAMNLQGDHNRLKQIIINILANALKFTPAGGKILISTARVEADLVMEIKDNGAGIAPEDLPRLGEKFFKARSQQPGSGLGLSISKEIIHLHQGELQIVSHLDEGTTVTVILPTSLGM